MTAPTSRLRRGLAPLLVAGLLAACGTLAADPGADPATTGSDMASDDAMSDDMSEGDHEMSEGEMSSEAAGSQAPDITATMADGSTITLADYAGEQLFVETFATWCSNCRRQLGDTTAAAAQAGDEATFLVLSVESNLDPAELDGYAAENGFEGLTFAVLDDASLATLSETFGNAVLVPPSTPKFTVAPDGTVGELVTGFESADEILGQLDATA